MCHNDVSFLIVYHRIDPPKFIMLSNQMLHCMHKSVRIIKHFPFFGDIPVNPEIHPTLIILNTASQSTLLYQKMWFGHIFCFYFHFSSFYLKLLISQSKLSGTRKFTLRY